MIYISAHKDFNLINQVILDNYKEYSIIDGGELKNEYSISVIHETSNNNKLYWQHHIYGDMTRQYYIYKNSDLYKDETIGFMQYRRLFNNDTLLNYKDILSLYDVIVPRKYSTGNIIHQYNVCHSGDLLNITLNLIYEYNEEYRHTIDIFRKLNYVIPHNMYIMKYNDFIEYCNFMFDSLELLNISKEQQYDRCYSFLAERLSTLFFIHYFNDEKIYYTDVIKIY